MHAAHIRWMIRRNMPEVLAIEGASYNNPWSEEELLGVLRQRNSIGMVAGMGERIVGFMIYELHSSQLNVLNFAIHPEFRQQGIGTKMVAKLKAKLSPRRRTRIRIEVKLDNLNARRFLAACGFRLSAEDAESPKHIFLEFALPAESTEGEEGSRPLTESDTAQEEC